MDILRVSPGSRIAIGIACGLLSLALSVRPAAPLEPPNAATTQQSDQPGKKLTYQVESLRGRIVWQNEALERRAGIRTVPESRERVIAIETRAGKIIPLIEDIRGRAFRVDKRLRDLADCELLVRRYDDSPAVQVIKIFTHEGGHQYELDYWCEICAIAMFELKACDCCQGEIEFRRRKVPVPRRPAPAQRDAIKTQ